MLPLKIRARQRRVIRDQTDLISFYFLLRKTENIYIYNFLMSIWDLWTLAIFTVRFISSDFFSSKNWLWSLLTFLGPYLYHNRLLGCLLSWKLTSHFFVFFLCPLFQSRKNKKAFRILTNRPENSLQMTSSAIWE